MYFLALGNRRTETFTTLAGVLSFFFDGPGLPDGLALEAVKLHSAHTGAIPLIRTGSSLGLRPPGTAREVMTRLVDEIDLNIVRPDGRVRLPFQMRRESWRAVMAVAELAGQPQRLLADEQRASGDLFAPPVNERVNPYDFLYKEFSSRFGFGLAGPSYDSTGQLNARHEVHVAFALLDGKPVRECVLSDYRSEPDAWRYGLEWAKVLADVPVLRGALSEAQLRNLVSVLRHDKLAVTAQNAEKLLGIVGRLPVNCTQVEVDDALYAAGILPPRVWTPAPPVVGEAASPISPLAKAIRDKIAQRRHDEMLSHAEAQRAAGRIGQRELDLRRRIAMASLSGESYGWGNKVALAVMAREVGFLLDVLDTPDDQNVQSKQGIQEHLGLKVRGLRAAQRREAIFAMCGFSADEAQVWEASQEAARAERKQAEARQDAIRTAESACYRLSKTEAVINGRQFVDRCFSEGMTEIAASPRGGAKVYHLRNPGTGEGCRLSARDGTLAYARAVVAARAAPQAA